MKSVNHWLLSTSLRVCAGVVLYTCSWQLVQATPQLVTHHDTHYRAISIHDAKWNKAHPHAVASQKRVWIKTLPHRYRIVKVHNQTYYYSHNKYYQRSGNGYVAVKIPFAPR